MYDLLIKQATIIDGTGIPGWRGDVAIKDGIFALIEPSISSVNAKEYISGSGLVLAPGFIDIHCHSDDFWLEDSLSEIKLQQGVTREVFGNCGVSMAPMGTAAMLTDFQHALSKIEKDYNSNGKFSFLNYRALLEEKGLYCNVMGLVGHGTIRFASMGFSDKIPNQNQMRKMENLLGQAMDQGALGMSTGLIYAPGIFAQIPELIKLSRIVAQKGGFYASHIRNEAEEVLAAIDEAITIGKHAGIPIQISHLKITGKKNWVLVDQVIDKLHSARKDGIDLTCDVYPYFSSRTSLIALIPPWAIEGGVEHLLPRLQNSAQRKKIIHDIRYGIPGWENMYHNAGWEKITISVFNSAEGKDIEGRTVAEIAKQRKTDPFELILNLIEREGDGVKIISETMNEENVAAFLKLPFAMVGSDSSFSQGSPHPRLYGTFPRVIRRFVREKKILKLEQAIYKMTGLPALRLKLKNAGLIKKGFQADAVLFDPSTISDRATYDDPCKFPSGITKVIVNGKIVINN
ncbi:MAG: N-acyl-D-amino-acid deacylase family protein, partial [Desulforhopalus sp.]